MRILRQLRAVIWSLIGVRRAADAARDLEGARPATIVAIGLGVAGLLVAGIALLVHGILQHRSVPQLEPRAATAPPASVAPARKHTGPVVVADTMEERVLACTVCHGNSTQASRDGFSPRIAGKPAGYLLNQLVSFRDGRRTYGPMVYMVQYMSDAYLREMADHFAQLELPYPPPETATLRPDALARVQRIVEHGDAARNVPACTSCHGARLAGVDPAIPGLLGLPRHYISAQFGAWRNGKLRSIAPDCMAEVARRLAAEDVPAIAAWLASQPVPPNARPEPLPARELPLECGSVKAALR